MLDRAETDPAQDLEQVITQNASIAMHCLAAAEQAVLQGRFNLAKVLRACAHSTRLVALNAARRARRSTSPTMALASTSAVFGHESPDRHPTPAPYRVVADVVRRSLASLERSRDVLESEVAQSLWGCQVCGAIVEGVPPDGCEICGALGFEFDWFGPFYSGTFERLGRRAPAEISDIVQDSPRKLTTLLDGVEEEKLVRRPSRDEWCIKEIAGHLVDVTELFSWRVQTILDTATPPSLEGPSPPWRLLEAKNYPHVPHAVITERFRDASLHALQLIRTLEPRNWGRFGLMRGRMTTVLDLGTWLANHNVAHFAQIQALREEIA